MSRSRSRRGDARKLRRWGWRGRKGRCKGQARDDHHLGGLSRHVRHAGASEFGHQPTNRREIPLRKPTTCSFRCARRVVETSHIIKSRGCRMKESQLPRLPENSGSSRGHKKRGKLPQPPKSRAISALSLPLSRSLSLELSTRILNHHLFSFFRPFRLRFTRFSRMNSCGYHVRSRFLMSGFWL
ncbi:hypothetical protein M758_12G122600 [Ceratodon purpureus]|uniref:Uncharacterized protein n=1 Tax=Ceratodon purpureus TaxID=3225 RepID=A0A8T0G8W8_CERPU|nr:hypothetical protein KC19_12G119800 [Ceratodon purpureus]KAG0599040.1 hypothetical protein M758_12G122600 [Ceratodon purpureus]